MADVCGFWLTSHTSGRGCVDQKGDDVFDIPDWETVVGFTRDWDVVIRWVNEGKLPYGS